MHRDASAVFAFVLAVASCDSFAPAEETPTPPVPGADASADSDGGPPVTQPDGAVLPDVSGDGGSRCTVFQDDFESWPTAGDWKILANNPASVTTIPGWNGRALEAYFPVQTQGTVRAQTYRSIARTGVCALDISFAVKVAPTADAARWVLLQVRGAAGGVVQIDHSGSFWYLRAGNTQSQIPAPAPNVVGRMRLVLVPLGAHFLARYTLDGGQAVTADDPATNIGAQADLLLGSEVAGATTDAIRAHIDDVRIEW